MSTRKPQNLISHHALLRYLERALECNSDLFRATLAARGVLNPTDEQVLAEIADCGFPVESVRDALLSPNVLQAMLAGASAVRIPGGVMLVLAGDGVAVTCVPDNVHARAGIGTRRNKKVAKWGAKKTRRANREGRLRKRPGDHDRRALEDAFYS